VMPGVAGIDTSITLLLGAVLNGLPEHLGLQVIKKGCAVDTPFL